MNKKQIEEILEKVGIRYGMDVGGISYIVNTHKLAPYLQPKFPEDSVVLTREEYIELKEQLKELEEQRDRQAYITEDLIQEKHLWTDQARKKMAREILKYIEQNFSEEWSTVDCLYDVHEWISNTFDIDLGDEDED